MHCNGRNKRNVESISVQCKDYPILFFFNIYLSIVLTTCQTIHQILDLLQFIYKSIRGQVMLGVGVWLTLCSKSSQKCSVGFCFGFCAGQSSCSTLDSVNHFVMDPALCTGRPCHAKIEKALQNVGTTLKAYNSLENRCIQQNRLHQKYRNSQNC